MLDSTIGNESCQSAPWQKSATDDRDNEHRDDKNDRALNSQTLSAIPVARCSVERNESTDTRGNSSTPPELALALRRHAGKTADGPSRATRGFDSPSVGWGETCE